MISCFESPIAFLNPQKLVEHSPLSHYPWQEDELPITRDEIKEALTKGIVIPPDIFSDEPNEFQRCNIEECSREEHIQRIAWFIEHPDTKLQYPIMASQNIHLEINNGHHRLAAAIYRGDLKIRATLNSVDIPLFLQHEAFLYWDQAPANQHYAGSNIISDLQQVFSINYEQIQGQKIWIHQENGNKQARFCAKKFIKSMEFEIEDNGELQHFNEHGEKVDLSYFLEAAGIHLSPLFLLPNIKNKINGLFENKKNEFDYSC